MTSDSVCNYALCLHFIYPFRYMYTLTFSNNAIKAAMSSTESENATFILSSLLSKKISWIRAFHASNNIYFERKQLSYYKKKTQLLWANTFLFI